MKTFEITLSESLHNKLETASKRAAKPVDQFVHELLARVLDDIEADTTSSEALLAEGYQMMATANIAGVNTALAAQLMAVDLSGGNGYGSDPAR